MIAIWGDDIVDNLPFPEDDEQYLTVDLPRKLGRRESFHLCMIDEALAADAQSRLRHEWPCYSVALLLQRAACRQ